MKNFKLLECTSRKITANIRFILVTSSIVTTILSTPTISFGNDPEEIEEIDTSNMTLKEKMQLLQQKVPNLGRPKPQAQKAAQEKATEEKSAASQNQQAEETNGASGSAPSNPAAVESKPPVQIPNWSGTGVPPAPGAPPPAPPPPPPGWAQAAPAGGAAAAPAGLSFKEALEAKKNTILPTQQDDQESNDVQLEIRNEAMQHEAQIRKEKEHLLGTSSAQDNNSDTQKGSSTTPKRPVKEPLDQQKADFLADLQKSLENKKKKLERHNTFPRAQSAILKDHLKQIQQDVKLGQVETVEEKVEPQVKEKVESQIEEKIETSTFTDDLKLRTMFEQREKPQNEAEQPDQPNNKAQPQAKNQNPSTPPPPPTTNLVGSDTIPRSTGKKREYLEAIRMGLTLKHVKTDEKNYEEQQDVDKIEKKPKKIKHFEGEPGAEAMRRRIKEFRVRTPSPTIPSYATDDEWNEDIKEHNKQDIKEYNKNLFALAAAYQKNPLPKLREDNNGRRHTLAHPPTLPTLHQEAANEAQGAVNQPASLTKAQDNITMQETSDKIPNAPTSPTDGSPESPFHIDITSHQPNEDLNNRSTSPISSPSTPLLSSQGNELNAYNGTFDIAALLNKRREMISESSEGSIEDDSIEDEEKHFNLPVHTPKHDGEGDIMPLPKANVDPEILPPPPPQIHILKHDGEGDIIPLPNAEENSGISYPDPAQNPPQGDDAGSSSSGYSSTKASPPTPRRTLHSPNSEDSARASSPSSQSLTSEEELFRSRHPSASGAITPTGESSDHKFDPFGPKLIPRRSQSLPAGEVTRNRYDLASNSPNTDDTNSDHIFDPFSTTEEENSPTSTPTRSLSPEIKRQSRNATHKPHPANKFQRKATNAEENSEESNPPNMGNAPPSRCSSALSNRSTGNQSNISGNRGTQGGYNRSLSSPAVMLSAPADHLLKPINDEESGKTDTSSEESELISAAVTEENTSPQTSHCLSLASIDPNDAQTDSTTNALISDLTNNGKESSNTARTTIPAELPTSDANGHITADSSSNDNAADNVNNLVAADTPHPPLPPTAPVKNPVLVGAGGPPPPPPPPQTAVLTNGHIDIHSIAESDYLNMTQYCDTTLDHRLNLVTDAAIAAGDAEEDQTLPKRVWVSSAHGISKYRRHDDQAKWYTGRTTAGTIGADIELANHSIVGIAYNYIKSNFKYKNSIDKAVTKTHLISLYAQGNLTNKLILQGFFSLGFGDMHTKTLFQNELVSNKIKNKPYNSKVVLAHKSNLGKLLIIPNIGLKYGAYNLGSYSQSFDPQSLSTVAGNSNRKTSGLVGIDAALPIHLSDTTIVTPGFHAEAEKFFHNKQSILEVSNAPNSSTAQKQLFLTEKPAKYSYKIGGSMSIKRGIAEIMTTYIYLTTDKKYSSHQGSIKLKLAF